MKWNWQKEGWTNFIYDVEKHTASEEKFIQQSGLLEGAVNHLNKKEQSQLHLELAEEEAFLTSQIEGEYLKRSSIRSSLEQQLGLQVKAENQDLREEGVSKMLMDVFYSHDKSLSHKLILQWHEKLFNGTMKSAGAYRKEKVQIISGEFYEPKVHFEGPPHETVKKEISDFIAWFNNAHKKKSPSPLILASITHLWFECIHPFPDGNGRVGRALVEYSLSKSLGSQAVISLSAAIEKKRKNYYNAFELSNQDNEINLWLDYFIPLILDAQNLSYLKMQFTIRKAKFYDHFKGALNPRQQKLIKRVFQEGVDGFQGGVSSANYLKITKTSTATASRDLKGLVDLGAFTKTGDKRHSRYWINLEI